jgi:hypothetical protein
MPRLPADLLKTLLLVVAARNAARRSGTAEGVAAGAAVELCPEEDELSVLLEGCCACAISSEMYRTADPNDSPNTTY